MLCAACSKQLRRPWITGALAKRPDSLSNKSRPRPPVCCLDFHQSFSWVAAKVRARARARARAECLKTQASRLPHGRKILVRVRKSLVGRDFRVCQSLVGRGFRNGLRFVGKQDPVCVRQAHCLGTNPESRPTGRVRTESEPCTSKTALFEQDSYEHNDELSHTPTRPT